MKTALALVALSVLFAMRAQPNGSGPGAAGGSERNRPGPWDNDVWVYAVGTNGTSTRVATFERAGVPTLARLKDQRIMAAFQHFPQDDERAFDRVAVCFSSDEGRTWTDNGTAQEFAGRPQRGQPPPGDKGYHALSTNGLDFVRVADLLLPTAHKRWLGNLQSDAGQLVFFGTGDTGLWCATSRAGENGI